MCYDSNIESPYKVWQDYDKELSGMNTYHQDILSLIQQLFPNFPSLFHGFYYRNINDVSRLFYVDENIFEFFADSRIFSKLTIDLQRN